MILQSDISIISGIHVIVTISPFMLGSHKAEIFCHCKIASWSAQWNDASLDDRFICLSLNREATSLEVLKKFDFLNSFLYALVDLDERILQKRQINNLS